MKRKLTTISLFGLLTLTSFAQSSVFKISFQSDDITYSGALLAYDDADWLLRLRFYDESCTCYHIIEESMRVAVVEDVGFKLRGYAVKDVITGQSVSSNLYVADNFYLYVDDYDNLRLTNIDNQLAISEVSIQKVSRYDLNTVLRPVNWTYNSYNASVVNTR